MREITLGSLFDGIGGFPLAALRYGIKAIWASEIELFPIKVTKLRFPEMEHLGDITKIDGTSIASVDIVTFGSPCTRLSVAGKHDGFDITFECFGDDEAEEPHYKNDIRATDKYQYEYKETCPVCGKELTQTNESALFFHAIRIITEMRLSNESAEYIRPRFAVWENVPGAFSSNKGEDFRQVLEEIIRIAEPEAPDIHVPEKGWPTYGSFRDMDGRWSVAWRVLDAQFWGVPQRRRRIFLVADFGGQSAPEILFKRQGLSRYSQESGKARERTATNIERSFRETGPGYWGEGIGCLRAEGENRPSRPSNVVVAIDSNCQDSRFKLTGQVVPTIPAKSGTGGNNGLMLAVAYGISAYGSNSMKSSNPHSGVYEANTSRTLDLNGGSPACNQGGIAIVQKINCQPSGISGTVSSKWSKGTGGPAWDEHYNLVCSVDCRNFNETEKHGTLQANGGQSLNYMGAVRKGYTVRRLTPLECERLQGYPDGWTSIEGANDSARYKALGNSVAIPCVEYVMEGITEVYRKEGAGKHG